MTLTFLGYKSHFNAGDRIHAEVHPKDFVKTYGQSQPKFVGRAEENLPEGF